jgi:O-6-methylguanine DNA methyltransferase
MREPTEFEMAVYEAVKRIPKGETRSYAWVAQEIGRPKAVRAVGNALNKNPFAPDVPCHRVIRSDGTVGGFAHGTVRKEQMLRGERAL